MLRDRALFEPALQQRLDAITDAANARFRRLGLTRATPPSDMTGAYFRCHRTPLMEGYVTQSLDGKPVAPLMGDVPEIDTGTLRTTLFPNFWQHTNCDHAAAARITPLGPTSPTSAASGSSMARRSKGKRLHARQAAADLGPHQPAGLDDLRGPAGGRLSRAYVPGPFSKYRERNVAQFLDWYLGEMQR